MDPVPHSLLAWLGLVFVLGLRHGLDADHLATIDGLARFNAERRPRLARWTGVLFSLGHGLVVIGVSVLMATLAGALHIPAWFGAVGVWTSVTLLTAIGLLNLLSLLRAGRDEVVRPVGLKGRYLRFATRARSPGAVLLVGALFAFAFDTLSQTATWALAASSGGGWLIGALLGAVFMLGMMLSDGLNSLWVARLLARADARARLASRIMGATVVGLSFGMAAYEAGSYFRPAWSSWEAGREWLLSVALIALLPLAFVLAAAVSGRRSLRYG